MNIDWHSRISQPQYGIKVERDIFVPMRDGVRLAVNIYRPDAPGKFPALLAMGGYGKELQEELIPPQPLYKSAVWDGNIEAGDTNDIVPRGYVHVIGTSGAPVNRKANIRGCGHRRRAGTAPTWWNGLPGSPGATATWV